MIVHQHGLVGYKQSPIQVVTMPGVDHYTRLSPIECTNATKAFKWIYILLHFLAMRTFCELLQWEFLPNRCPSCLATNKIKSMNVNNMKNTHKDNSVQIALIATNKWLNTHNRFNGHFGGKPTLASCPIDSQSTVILILSICTGQAKTLHIQLTSDCSLNNLPVHISMYLYLYHLHE